MTEQPAPAARLIQLVPGTPVPSDQECPICFGGMCVTPIFIMTGDGLTKVGELACCFACATVD